MIAVIIIAFFLVIVYLGLLLYCRAAWNAIPCFSYNLRPELPSTYISILVPARNEETNLLILLNALLSQDYPAKLYEVIVIDDFSTDGTASIVRSFENENVKLISLADYVDDNLNSYKKKAIELGINNSKGQLIVTTDADCYMPTGWLKTIAHFYEETKSEFIVMPVVMNCSNRFLEIFQSLDFMSLQGITGAAVHKKFLSMCNGANLAYTKKAFTTVSGFRDINGIASGDDMLLMQKISKAFPAGISYLKSEAVVVRTEPMYTLKEFINQRIRWASKADKYDDKKMFFVLAIVYGLNLILLMLPFIAILNNRPYTILNLSYSIFQFWLILLVLKTLAEIYFLFPVACFFHKERLLWFFPFAQPFHILYTVIAGWLGKFGSYYWKERKVK